MDIIEEFLREDLKQLQEQPYEDKLERTKMKVKDFIDSVGLDKASLMFSGGKDSTVLLHIVRNMYPSIRVVFANTGIEFPEVTKFVKETPNVEVVRTPYKQIDIYERVGYPVVSKEVSKRIRDGRRSSNKRVLDAILGLRGDLQKLNKHYLHFLDTDFVSYQVSNSCCYYFKKKPLKANKNIFVGTRTEESLLRTKTWMRYGCNHFGVTKNSSAPLSTWLEVDIHKYIKDNNVAISTIYTEKGALRTGCYNCPYGMNKEETLINNNLLDENRYEKLIKFHPKLYDYSMDIVGMRQVLLDSGVRIRKDKEYMKQFFIRAKEIDNWYRNYDTNMNKILDSIALRGVVYSTEERQLILDNNRLTEKSLRSIIQFNKKTGEQMGTFKTIKEAERKTGLDYSNIAKACRGKLKSAGGYVWKFSTDVEENIDSSSPLY